MVSSFVSDNQFQGHLLFIRCACSLGVTADFVRRQQLTTESREEVLRRSVIALGSEVFKDIFIYPEDILAP